MRQSRLVLPHRTRELCTSSEREGERGSIQGAFGSRGSRGSGKSLMGSKARGVRQDDLERLEAGELGWDGSAGLDDELEAGDVLMEILAEDHRRNRTVDFFHEGVEQEDGAAADEPKALPNSGKRVAHRRYLTHSDVGPGTIYERQAASQRRRLEGAVKHAFDYSQPEEVKRQREHDQRARARQRDHDVVENRIQEAFVSGAFDNLPGAGQPLKAQSNVFEEMAGEAVAHRVLKNAGMTPAWIELSKTIRGDLRRAKRNLLEKWSAIVGADEEGSWDMGVQVGKQGESHGEGEVERRSVEKPAALQPTEQAAAAVAVAASSTRWRQWAVALDEFDGELAEINRQIVIHNLQASGEGRGGRRAVWAGGLGDGPGHNNRTPCVAMGRGVLGSFPAIGAHAAHRPIPPLLPPQVPTAVQHLHPLRRERELERSMADEPRRRLFAQTRELRLKGKGGGISATRPTAAGSRGARPMAFFAEGDFSAAPAFPSLFASLSAAFSFK